ncbi:hypothetical protein [Streptomyces sp. LUP47B]|uniref:hypothetical protein n=1 Tax=Streptomyces sp. LUP47B TaxID=1890286 RepID=UPI00114D239C|nr:hypothetical protein [Streptomyces sp. LUP47B]
MDPVEAAMLCVGEMAERLEEGFASWAGWRLVPDAVTGVAAPRAGLRHAPRLDDDLCGRLLGQRDVGDVQHVETRAAQRHRPSNRPATNAGLKCREGTR